MLEFFFKSPTRLRQLRRGTLADHVDGLAAELRQKGYVKSSAQRVLSLTGRFSLFAQTEGVKNAEEITEALISRFLDDELPKNGAFKSAPNVMRHLLDYLRRHGLAALPRPTATDDPFAHQLGQYDCHLRDVRGLLPPTRETYIHWARRLLTWYSKYHPEQNLEDLSGPDVLQFIREFLPVNSKNKSHRGPCSATRSFLRYLRWEEIIKLDLDRVVPKVPRWRLSSVPRHLPWDQVRALIDSVDTSHPQGMRDKAVLLLLASLGLRNKEVRTLEFGHIAWRTAEIRLPETKSKRAHVLPLAQEVGEALADYVLHGRPRFDTPRIFLRHSAPVGILKTSGAIVAIVEKHLRRVGIDAPSNGAHMLRHSLATRMVNAGVSIKEIADVLGHQSIDTTAIYTKVDVTNLGDVALPFPEGDAQ